MSFFGAYPPTKPLSNFDLELQDFYHELMTKILEKEKTKKIVLETLRQVKIKRIQKTNSKVALQKTAYLFRYGPCHTSAVANHMVRMIKDNPFILKQALLQRCVNFCCFGYAPVIELVAICKVLSLADNSFWKLSQKPLQINVTIIGKNPQLEKTVNYALEVLMKSSTILDTSKMALSVNHVKANPAKMLKNSVVDILKKADIVTMVKFASMMRVATLIEQLMWEIADTMKMDSVLFFLDTGMFPHCKLVGSILDPLEGMQSIFGPNNIDPFTLNINSIQKCVKLYWTKFENNICLTSCTVNSAAWRKTEFSLTFSALQNVSRKNRLEKSMAAKRDWCEKQLISQKTLEDHHQKVRQVLPNKNNIKLKNITKLRKSVLFCSKSKEKRIYLV